MLCAAALPPLLSLGHFRSCSSRSCACAEHGRRERDLPTARQWHPCCEGCETSLFSGELFQEKIQVSDNPSHEQARCTKVSLPTASVSSCPVSISQYLTLVRRL